MLLLAGALTAGAFAQDGGARQTPSRDSERRANSTRPATHGERRPPRDRHEPRGEIGEGLPFRPSEEDMGPLRPEEQKEFDRFARTRMPNAYRALKELRDQNPEAFKRRMDDEIAPRFRFMQRMLSENPKLGENILAHAENLQAIRQNARLLRDPKLRPIQRRRVLAETRQHMLDNVALEAEVREERLRMREQERDGELDSQLEKFADPQSNLDDAPQELRPMLERWRNADPQARDQMRARLRQRMAERDADDIARQREQIQKLRDGADAEAERRLQRLLDASDKPGQAPPDRTNRRTPRGEKP